MEFKNFIFQAWEVKEFNGRSLKIMENYSFVSTVVYFSRPILATKCNCCMHDPTKE